MPRRSVPQRSALNASQQAVLASEASALLVTGSIGSGKTTVLAYRAIAQSMHFGEEAKHKGKSAARIVAASAERARRLLQMIERIADQEGTEPTVEVVTVPQWAAQVLRREKPSMTRSILRSEQAQDLVGEVLSSLGFKDLGRAPFEVWREIHARGMQGESGPGMDAENSPLSPSFPLDADDFRKVWAAYDHRLRRARALDIPRLLKAAIDVASLDTPTGLLIDDLNDLPPLERSFLRRSSAQHRTVAGEIRPGKPGVSEGEEGIFQDETPFQHITLSESFVPDSIAQAVCAVTGTEPGEQSTPSGSGSVQVATAPSGAQEAEQIARYVCQKVEEGAWDAAGITVCAGAEAVRTTVESALRGEGLRVRVPGRPFQNQRGSSDLLAYLHVLANPHDDIHLMQIVNRPSRGIGRKTQARIKAYAAGHNLSVWDAIPHADDQNALTSRARRVLRTFRDLLNPLVETLHDPATLPAKVRDIARDLIRKTEYLTNVTRGQTREQIEKEEQVERLLCLLPAAESPRDASAELTARSALQRVLDRFALGVVDAADADARMNDAVTLTSIREVRGIPAGVVIVAGLEEGVCPGEWAVRREDLLEDERQALAQAMASARETLLLTWAQSRGHGREEEPTTRSRFLDTLYYNDEPVPWVQPVSLRTGDNAPGYQASLRAKQARSTASAPPTDADIDHIAAGQRVRHPKLGNGTVESVTTDNGRRIAEVSFDERGTKTLQLKYAPLDVLE